MAPVLERRGILVPVAPQEPRREIAPQRRTSRAGSGRRFNRQISSTSMPERKDRRQGIRRRDSCKRDIRSRSSCPLLQLRRQQHRRHPLPAARRSLGDHSSRIHRDSHDPQPRHGTRRHRGDHEPQRLDRQRRRRPGNRAEPLRRQLARECRAQVPRVPLPAERASS